jgi:hypothetical protein
MGVYLLKHAAGSVLFAERSSDFAKGRCFFLQVFDLLG